MKRLLAMPATAANLAALFAIVISILIAVRHVQAGTITFILFSYIAWTSARAANVIFGMQKYRPALFSSWFSDNERSIYKRFALYIHQPKLAYLFSTTLHWLRLAAVPFIAIALWRALYIEAGLLALSAVLSSGTIAAMYPDLYFGDAAKRGNLGAAEMLHTLHRVQEIMEEKEEQSLTQWAEDEDSSLMAQELRRLRLQEEKGDGCQRETDPIKLRLRQAAKLNWKQAGEITKDGEGAPWMKRNMRFLRGEEEAVLWHKDATVTLVRLAVPFDFEDFIELEEFIAKHPREADLDDATGELRYLREIELAFVRYGYRDDIMRIRATDYAFVVAFGKLFKAGYAAEADSVVVAALVLRAMQFYEHDPERSIRLLTRTTEGFDRTRPRDD